jgi:hypothetical protein
VVLTPQTIEKILRSFNTPITAGVTDPGYSLSKSSITFSMPLTTSVKRS